MRRNQATPIQLNMKADTIQDVDIKRLLLKLESAFLTHQEVEELAAKVKRLEMQIEIARLEEQNRCINIIENYQIPVGNSAAGEIACEMTYAALRDIRDRIRGRTE
jgi:hypothetical protein